MNQNLQIKWPWIEGSHTMRADLLNRLSDADLAFAPGGATMTLGELWREMGETEYSYNQSLRTFTQDWTYRNPEPGLAGSVTQLQAWFSALDEEMKTLVTGFSDDDLARTVQRSGNAVPVDMQLDVYLQALLIFFGKVTIYFRLLNKELPSYVQEYIG